MDAEMITALYKLKNEIETITEGDVLTLANVLTKFDAMMDKMDEKEFLQQEDYYMLIHIQKH